MVQSKTFISFRYMIVKPPNGYLRHPNKTKLQYNYQQIGEIDYISIVVLRQSDNQLFLL